MKYKSFFDFVCKTPKNLASIVVIWGMCLLLFSGVFEARYEMHLGWQVFSYVFLLSIVILGWLRVYLIYRKVR